MDFFQYISYASIFFNLKTMWVELLVGGLCFAIVYIFQAVGLYTIAVKNGYNHKWMAFVPFFNTFYVGYVSQRNRCFRGVNTKILAIVVASFEVVLFTGFILDYVAQNIVLSFDPPEIYSYQETAFGTLEMFDHYDLSVVPARYAWAKWVFNYLSGNKVGILSYVNIVFVIMKMFLLVCFFQTYAARRYFLFSITSVLFPIFGILVFVVRNNTGMSYQQYIRAEQERRYRMYQQYQQQQQQNFNQNPYNRNPYRNDYDGAPKSSPQDDPYDGVGANTDNGNQSGNSGGNSGGNSDDPFEGFDSH